jgi:hypothetical protein
MPDWDRNSPQLAANLRAAMAQVRKDAQRRVKPELALARDWHSLTMQGLAVPRLAYIRNFRGETGLEKFEVLIGSHFGVRARSVHTALKQFERELQRRVTRLDQAIPPKAALTGVQLGEIIELCAWTHSEWIRIHPFANGNGRTARIWTNFIAMRYGLPPFVRLRPRPHHGYEEAGAKAMRGDWKPTARSFKSMLKDLLAR